MDTEEQLKEEIFGRLVSIQQCAKDIASKSHPEMIGPLISDLSVLHARLAELLNLSSMRVEKQTNTLITLTKSLVRLTWAIVFLTVAILIFTIFH